MQYIVVSYINSLRQKKACDTYLEALAWSALVGGTIEVRAAVK